MSAKKYLKTVPPQPPAQPAAKTEKEEQLWNALKRHIMRERERKKQEMEQEVEEERLRKEREAREKQDVMTLGETKEQIQILETTLQQLRNEKQQLFLQLKKVLNEDDNRKRQLKEEMFAKFNNENRVMSGGHKIFFQQRTATVLPVQHTPHHLHKGNQPVNVNKRTHSPSPQGYYNQPSTSQGIPQPQQQQQPQKPEESRRGPGEVSRAVLWNRNHCPPSALFYPSSAPPPPSNPNDRSAPQPQIIYPAYQTNLPLPIRQAYHVELPPQVTQQNPQVSSQKGPTELQLKGGPGPAGVPPSSANVYHITLDPQIIPQPQPNPPPPGPPPQLKAITIEKLPPPPQQQQQQQQDQQRGVPYHIELKHDDRKDLRGVPNQPPPPQSMVPQPQPPPPVPQQVATHLPEGIVYAAPPVLRQDSFPMHAIASNQQLPKGGSITQGYPPVRPPPMANPQQPQPPPQVHYQRHRY